MADDVYAGRQAAMVVMLVGLFEVAVYAAAHEEPAIVAASIAYGILAVTIGWVLWAGIVYFVGVRAFGLERKFPAILRAMGFAHSPGLVYGLSTIPPLHLLIGPLYFLSLFWFLAAFVAAVRGMFGTSVGWTAAVVGGSLAAHEVIRQGLRLFGLLG